MISCAKRAVFAALMGTAALTLAACNGGPASEPARDHAQQGEGARMASAGYTSSSGGGSTRSASYAEDRADPRRQPIPLVKGKPMWAANRQHTAQENAEYQFEHDGPDFGATSVDDFVTKVHAFVDKPPRDVMTLTRANGDRLLYDTHGNVFAVVTKDGAPRTMFKPRTGEAYWEEQKAREAAQAERADAGGGRGYYRGKSSGESGSDDQG